MPYRTQLTPEATWWWDNFTHAAHLQQKCLLCEALCDFFLEARKLSLLASSIPWCCEQKFLCCPVAAHSKFFSRCLTCLYIRIPAVFIFQVYTESRIICRGLLLSKTNRPGFLKRWIKQFHIKNRCFISAVKHLWVCKYPAHRSGFILTFQHASCMLCL